MKIESAILVTKKTLIITLKVAKKYEVYGKHILQNKKVHFVKTSLKNLLFEKIC